MKRALIPLLAVLLVVLAVGCTNDRPTIDPSLVSKDPAALSQSYDKFAFDLLSKQPVDQNVFLSPISASIALSVAGEGAQGKTKDEIENVLHTNGLSQAEIRAENLGLLKAINGTNDVTLSLATGLFVNQNATLNADFSNIARGYYLAEAQPLDMSSPSAPDTVNQWVSDRTNGKITKIVNKLGGELFLANAVYFKGDWSHPFDPSMTKTGNFYTPAGIVQTPLMEQDNLKAMYDKGPDFQSLILPYGDQHDIALHLYLPDYGVSINDFLHELTYENWAQEQSQYRQAVGLLKLPKLELNESYTLNDTFKSLGMNTAFQDGADFSLLTKTPLKMDQISQNTYLKMDEKGTEAAAATGFSFGATAPAPPRLHFQMIVDHPYFFTIEQESNHCILFMGVVTQPAE